MRHGRLRAAGALGLWLLSTALAVTAPALLQAQPDTPLRVVTIDAEPHRIRVGRPVTVTAVLENPTGSSIGSVSLSVIASSSDGDRVAFERLATSAATDFRDVPPGGRVTFRDTVRIEQTGLVALAVAGVADGRVLFPGPGVRIRVASHPLAALGDVLLAFCLYAVLISLATAGLRAVLGGADRGPIVSPRWPLLAVGGTLAVLALLGVATDLPAAAAGRSRLPRVAALLVLFAAGWLVGGAALRPRGNPVRGIAAAVTAYVFTGYLWLATYNALVMGTSVRAVAGGLLRPGTVLVAVQWPVQVAQALGLLSLAVD